MDHASAYEICNYAFKNSKQLIDSIYHFLKQHQQNKKLKTFNIDGQNLTLDEISNNINISITELHTILNEHGLKYFIHYVNYMMLDELKDELADYNIDLNIVRKPNQKVITINFNGKEITHTYKEWAKILNISYDTILYWLDKGKNLPDKQQLIKDKILRILNNTDNISSYDIKIITINFNDKEITHTYNEWINILNIHPSTLKKWLLDSKNLSDPQQIAKEKILSLLNHVKINQKVITVNFNGQAISKTYQQWSEYLNIPFNTLRYK